MMKLLLFSLNKRQGYQYEKSIMNLNSNIRKAMAANPVHVKKYLSLPGILPAVLVGLLMICQNISGQTTGSMLNSEISLEVSRGTVHDIITELSENHQVQFSYDPGIIPMEKLCTLSASILTLAQILDQVFLNTRIKYTAYNSVIILSKRKEFIVSGFIENKISGERLIGATIFEHSSHTGTVSNNYGFFSMTVLEGDIILNASFVGYKTANHRIELTKDTSLVIGLEPGMEIEEVSVSARMKREELTSSEISVEKIAVQSLKTIPVLLGEGDVLKMMQYLPGIQFGTETSSGLVVRGGNPEQNLILLDGAPVYNSNHAFGLFSVFNPDAIKNVSLIKGGFPARYGGRLSSVIDVRMNEGNMKEFSGNATIGTIASKFNIEGPIIKDKSSFNISARRTYVDLLLPKKFKEDEDIPMFSFYDLNAKLNYKLSRKDRLFLSFYAGHDRFTEEESYTSDDGNFFEFDNNQANWGNKTLLTRWNHLFSNKLFSNLSLVYTKYEVRIDVEDDEKEFDDYYYSAVIYNSGIQDLSVLYDVDYYPHAKHKIKFGSNYIYHTFNPGVLRKVSQDYYFLDGEKYYTASGNVDEINRNPLINASEFRAFMEDDFILGEKYFINTGLHYSGFYVHDVYYSSLEPRISATRTLTDDISVKAAYSRMKQYLHLLTHSGMGLPTDLWMPVTARVKPQYSNQYTLGMVYHINESYKLNVETYYKSLHQIYAYKEGVDYLSANNSWESNIAMGNGRSFGTEFMIRKSSGKLDGWMSYTWSKTDRKFEELNYSKSFPYKYDRTHQLNTVLKYAFNEKFSLNASWIYATGMAYTLSTSKYTSLLNLYNWNSPNRPSGFIDAIDNRNNIRMPDYHRLDLALSYHKAKQKVSTTWLLSVYNVYNRFNPYLSYWDDDMGDLGKRKVKQVALFSVIPALSVRLEF